MAQRRYTQSEVNAALASGERAPDDKNWWSTMLKPYIPEAASDYLHGQERWYRGVGAGAINALPQVLQAPEFIGNVGGATKDWAQGKPFAQSLYTRTVGGEAGVKKLDDYLNTELNAYLAELPAHQRNDPEIKSKLSAYIQGSEGYNRLREAQTGALNQWSLDKQDWVRDKLGLQPSYAMTSQDELADFVGGALLPLPSKITSGIKALPVVPRVGARLLEAFSPGSTGPVSFGFNVAIPEVATQTIRHYGGSPNFASGTASLPEELAAGDQTGPATSSNTPPSPQRRIVPQEDANAPGPFSMAAAASPLGSPQQPASQPTASTAQPLVNQPTSALSTASASNRDPDNGGNGSGWAKALAVGGALSLIAAASRGKLPRGIATRVVEDVDSPSAVKSMQPTPTDHITLGKPAPGSDRPVRLTTWQKVKTGATKSAAPEYAAENALKGDPDVDTKIARINRENHAASRLETNYAAKRTYSSGELPGLHRRTLKTTDLRKAHDALTPAEQELFKQHIVFNERMDHYAAESGRATDAINDAYIKLRTVTNANKRTAMLSDIRAKEQALRARNDPQAQFESGVTVGDARAAIAAGDANPKIRAIVTAMKRIRDDVDEAGVNMGQFTWKYLADTYANRPHFLPLATNPDKYVDVSGDVKTKGFGTRLAESVAGRKEPGEKGFFANEMYSGRRSPARTNAGVKGDPIGTLNNPLDALETHIFDFHRQLRANRAAQTFTETILGADNKAATNDWGRSVQRAHAPLSIQDFEHKSRNDNNLKKILREPNVYVYNADGQMHIMRAADSEIARAMRQNPSSTLGMWDGMRKTAQFLYTGNTLAPWFAPVAAENDLAVARVALPHKYTVGYLDELSRAIFPNNRLFRYYPDPTFKLMQLGAIAKQVSVKALMKGGEVLGQNMAMQSSLIRALGPMRASAVGQTMIRTVNEMIEEFRFMEMHNIIDTQHVVEHNERTFAEWGAAKDRINSIPGIGHAKTAFNGWIQLAEAVRNAPRLAITSRNLARLMKETNGNPTNAQLREFIKDMRYMSGDMSRAIGNPAVAMAASAMPYGQNAINSVSHLMEAFAKNPTQIGGRIVTNMVAPKVVWTLLLTGLIGKEFSDYYWDEMPTWQRQGVIPMLSPSYLVEQAHNFVTGGTDAVRKPSVNDVIFMRHAPEAIPLAETAMSALQATGLFNLWSGEHATHPQDVQTWADAVHAWGSMVNVSVPAFDAITRMFTDTPSNNAADLSSDSDTVRRFSDAGHAVLGGVFDVVKAGFGAAGDAIKDGESVSKVFSQTLQFAYEAGKQRFPETPLSPLFGGQRRHYTKSAMRDRNQDKFKAIEAVSGQLSEQRKNQRLPGPDKPSTQDPQAVALMHELDSTANSGIMHALRKERSDLYSQLERLDELRGNNSAADYTKQSEHYKMLINDKDRQEEEVFDRLTTRLRNHYGHLGVEDIDSAVAYIKSTVHP